MRIGELAARSSVPAKTIRYYEEIGVLQRPRRAASGYRDYEPDAAERLRFVRDAKAVGLSLGEIREIVAMRDRGETPCAHVTELLQRHAADIDRKIAELERVRAEVRRLARRARRLDPRDCDPTRVCHLIEGTPTRRRS